MQKFLLSEQEQRSYGFTHRVRLTHADLTETAANTAQTIALITVADGSLVIRCAMRLVTAFKNSADAAFNTTAMVVGDGNVTNRFLTTTELNENGTEILAKAGAPTTQFFAYQTGDTIDVVVSAMAAKSLVDLDTGEVDILLHVQNLDDLN